MAIERKVLDQSDALVDLFLAQKDSIYLQRINHLLDDGHNFPGLLSVYCISYDYERDDDDLAFFVAWHMIRRLSLGHTGAYQTVRQAILSTGQQQRRCMIRRLNIIHGDACSSEMKTMIAGIYEHYVSLTQGGH